MQKDKKEIKVEESQVEAYKKLVKMGANDENLLGLIDEETLNEIKSRVALEIDEKHEQEVGVEMEM